MNKIMVLPENTTVDDLEGVIEDYIADKTGTKIGLDAFDIIIKDIKYINNRYILIYDEIPVPVRKFGIFKTQNKIDASVTKIKEFLTNIEDDISKEKIDNVKIESFTIYEDHADRARDHAIILYSYNTYNNHTVTDPEG